MLDRCDPKWHGSMYVIKCFPRLNVTFCQPVVNVRSNGIEKYDSLYNIHCVSLVDISEEITVFTDADMDKTTEQF